MFQLLIVFSIITASVYGRFMANEDSHDHLERIATEIMQSMQNDHLPSGSTQNGVHNSPVKHLMDGNLIKNFLGPNEKDKINVKFGLKGYRFVSVEQNGKVVNISSEFGIGAGAIYNVDKNKIGAYDEDDDEQLSDEFLAPIIEEYVDLSDDDERIKVVAGQKAKFGMEIKRKGKNAKVKAMSGWIACARTNVTRGSL